MKFLDFDWSNLDYKKCCIIPWSFSGSEYFLDQIELYMSPVSSVFQTEVTVRNKLFNSPLTIFLFIWEQYSVKTQKLKRSQFHKLLHQGFHSTLFDRPCQMRTFNIEILSMSVVQRVLWKETLWKVAGGWHI